MKKMVTMYLPSRIARVLTLVLGIALMNMPLSAQQFFGSVVGTVTDPSGAVVPGATVVITNAGTNEKHTAKSSSAGNYQFVNLVPATYKVEIDTPGFKRFVLESVEVEVGSAVRGDARLQIGAMSEVVEVSTAGVQLQTDSGTISNRVTAEQVADLPLNGRNIMQLLNITPGVIPGSAIEQGATLAQNNGTSTNPLSWGGGSNAYTINGGDNEEYLDGAPINVLQGSNIALMPTADAIQEFNIDTNNYGAEEGRATGGIINQTSKSGTNQFHGTAYEYFRNAALNANNFFNKRAGIGRPKFNQNLFGFTLGFPIKRDKVFFFGSFEDNVSLTQSATATNEPTNGNAFSGGLPGGGTNIYNGVFTRQIVDPTGKCPSINAPAPSNSPALVGIYHDSVAQTWTLGQGCWDSTATILRTYWARQPNASSSNTNYVVNLPAGDTALQMNVRMDFNVSSKQRLFVHTAWWNPTDKPFIPYPNPDVPSALPGGKPWGLSSAVGGLNSNLNIVGDTYTFSPKTVFDIRAVNLRFRYNQVPGVNNFDLSGLGPNWGQFNNYLPSGNHWLPSPSFGAGGQVHNLAPTGLGFGFAPGGQGQIWDTYGLNGSLTHVFGRHSIKFGFEARLMDLNVLPSNFAAGAPTFGIRYSQGQSTNAAGANYCNPGVGNTGCGDEWAEMLLGQFSTASFSGSYGGTEFNWYQAYFAQDTFQVAQKLTLNLGLRWELPGGLMEKKDNSLVFLPYATDAYTGAYGAEALVNSALSPSRSIFPVKHTLFNPRVGFAYRLNEQTVVRGGYGITNQAVDLDGGGSGAAGVAINAQQLAWTNPSGTGQVPTAFLSNPIPNIPSVYVPALRRTPNFVQILATAAQTSGGFSLNGFWKDESLPYVQQYNLAFQRQTGRNFQFTMSYVGSHGVHLKAGGPIDQIPASAYSVSGTGTNQTAVATTGPYAGMSLLNAVPTGGTITLQGGSTQTFGSGVYCTPTKALCNSNWLIGQTLEPYPNYKNATIGNLTYGNQHYNSLQISTQWRTPGGGLVTGAYTWAKTINDLVNFQDYNNHAGDRTVTGVPMRLAVTMNYPLPFGRGQRFFNSDGPISTVISGWTINNISSFQHGGYLSLTSNTQNRIQQNFGGGTTRASYTQGCNKVIDGAAYSRLSKWFNTSCFYFPGNFSFGNEPASDPQLFAQGIHNWDLSLLKTTRITERLNSQFRVETFNTFNRFQAGTPNTAVGNASFGVVTSQANNPRQVQLSLRLNY